ncbi:MAG: DegT/DnrJ/EryC1/StrS family aminotransferase, partial [Chloroflexota bacterium]
MEPAVRAVLAGGQYILGAEVQAFEAELAAYCGAAHGIGVA